MKTRLIESPRLQREVIEAYKKSDDFKGGGYGNSLVSFVDGWASDRYIMVEIKDSPGLTRVETGALGWYAGLAGRVYVRQRDASITDVWVAEGLYWSKPLKVEEAISVPDFAVETAPANPETVTLTCKSWGIDGTNSDRLNSVPSKKPLSELMADWRNSYASSPRHGRNYGAAEKLQEFMEKMMYSSPDPVVETEAVSVMVGHSTMNPDGTLSELHTQEGEGFVIPVKGDIDDIVMALQRVSVTWCDPDGHLRVSYRD